jgi:hypothetical protein
VAAAVYTHNGSVGFTMFGNEDVIPDQKAIERIVKVHLVQEFEDLFKSTTTRHAGSGFA